MSGLRSRMRLCICMVVLALGATALLVPEAPTPVAAGSTTASVWLQTMDSCKDALGGGEYQVVGDNDVDYDVSTPNASRQSVGSGSCPLVQGNCSSISAGCIQFTGLPPGSYRIHELVTPPGNTSNPEGYAPCNGGSACWSQDVVLTVSSSGTASATVTNVEPDGTEQVHTYPGTAKDPIVVHNFGLAPPGYEGSKECDGDGDADDHSTGTPSSHCEYPESLEATACQPFPWSCTLAPLPPVGSSSSSSSSSSTSTSTSSSTTSTTSSSTSCALTTTSSGKLEKGSSKSVSMTTKARGGLTATVTWTRTGTVRLQLLTSKSKVVAQTTVTGTSLQLSAPGLAEGRYTLSLKLSGTSSVTYSLSSAHC